MRAESANLQEGERSYFSSTGGARGKRDVHQVSAERCASFLSAERVMIDPGAQTEKERGPGEDPVQDAMVSDGW
jgi:hypothetical protein